MVGNARYAIIDLVTPSRLWWDTPTSSWTIKLVGANHDRIAVSKYLRELLKSTVIKHTVWPATSSHEVHWISGKFTRHDWHASVRWQWSSTLTTARVDRFLLLLLFTYVAKNLRSVIFSCPDYSLAGQTLTRVGPRDYPDFYPDYFSPVRKIVWARD